MECVACKNEVKQVIELIKYVSVCPECFNAAPLIDDELFLTKWVAKRQESLLQMIFMPLLDYIMYKGWNANELLNSDAGIMNDLVKDTADLKSEANQAITLVIDDNQTGMLGRILQHQIRLLDHYMEGK